jgi:DNA polymerase
MSALTELHQKISACQRCELFKNRTKAVSGEGAVDADLMFIGEAPGWHEDQQGRPFVGSSGQYLDSLLASINLRREQVYITNVVKSRPPDNRDPLLHEVSACRIWLDRQIEIIHPKMIVTLGRYSLGLFFPGKSISKTHGTAQKKDGIIYFAMYHPAAALHQGSLRNVIEEDMRKIPVLLAQIGDVAETKPESQPQQQQLNLFGD